MRLSWVTATRAVFALFALSGIAYGRALVTTPIDDTRLVTLAGNTRPEATAANDRGAVADTLPLQHMLLLLQPSPERQAALERAIEDLQDPQSPEYHHWLSAAEFGHRFGADGADLAAIGGWLATHGFRVDGVYPNRLEIDFSGTAGEVRATFHTEIHNLEVDGVPHIANMSDPEIPAALAPLVAGIVSLNDFQPAPQYTFDERCAKTSVLGGRCYALVPADLATIYDLAPLHQAGVVGTGEKIVVIEASDLYSATDWSTFRATFGLAGFPGSFRQIHPQPPHGANNCADPHVNGAASEATLDAEWSSAAAPGAAIVAAACAELLIAVTNIVNGAPTPDVVSISYGECEAKNGVALNAAFAAIYRQAIAEGISVFVSAGDSGGAGCDPHKRSHNRPGLPARHGLAVNAWASTAYDVAVGGTDFADTYTGANVRYWTSTNGGTYGSALSYIPEIPWDGTCGSRLLAWFLSGSARTYGASGFCNTAAGKPYDKLGAGSGGPSGCAFGTPSPSTPDVVSGSCRGYKKPRWQRGVLGNPDDGVRDLPDVALYASGGSWGHRYVFCFSDPKQQGKPCIGPPSGWSGGGGTSFAAPIMAGIQALVDEHAGGRQGNPAPIYYRLAATEYGTRGSPACNASRGNRVDAHCIFHDVTVGDTDEPCITGSDDCFNPGGRFGVLSTSDRSYEPAYVADVGWDFASGLGSVDAANLVKNWPR
jgi:subtilase family serine protease